MLYPNVDYMLTLRTMHRWELAAKVGMSESRFSRCMNARKQFTRADQDRIAEVLGVDRGWLFSQPTPPQKTVSGPGVEARDIRGGLKIFA